MIALREAKWAEEADKLLVEVGKTRADTLDDWKIAVAEALRRMTSATNGRIADLLHMGTGGSVRK